MTLAWLPADSLCVWDALCLSDSLETLLEFAVNKVEPSHCNKFQKEKRTFTEEEVNLDSSLLLFLHSLLGTHTCMKIP